MTQTQQPATRWQEQRTAQTVHQREQQLDLQAVAGPKLKLVLNHANAKVKLDVKEIERVLGMSANFPIPDDIAVPISVNAGRPVVVDEPKSPVSRALDCIAESLLGPTAAPKKSRRGK